STAILANGRRHLLAGQPAAAREPADRSLRNDHRRGFAGAGVARGARGIARPHQPRSVQHHRSMNPHSSLLPTVLSIVLTLNIAAPLRAAGPPPAPVPKSPYIAVVYRFADTLLDRGRDTHGAQRTPLFVSALDRTTLAPLERRPPAPGNIPEVERAGATNSLAGSNLQHDENLFRLLYLLSELTNKPKYRDAADAALTWFFTNTQSAATGLLPWGNRLSWDTALEQPTVVGDTAVHQFYRPWLLW